VQVLVVEEQFHRVVQLLVLLRNKQRLHRQRQELEQE
jgi:hypothetical protein